MKYFDFEMPFTNMGSRNDVPCNTIFDAQLSLAAIEDNYVTVVCVYLCI